MVKISKNYVPKLTEKYMCEKHKAYFKKKLTEWKSDIIKTNNEALYNGSLDDNSVSIGWYLGGTVGIGTLLFAFGIGPAVALGLFLVKKIFS